MKNRSAPGLDGTRSEGAECSVLPPEQFHLLGLPFFPDHTMDGRPPLLPPGLPPQYVQVSEIFFCYHLKKSRVHFGNYFILFT